jgi:hypothetical protein
MLLPTGTWPIDADYPAAYDQTVIPLPAARSIPQQ